MKGKKVFKQMEIEELKKLIKAKESATPNKQKRIRNLIRKIGFYYSDFRSQKEGYTVNDFLSLIRSGEISISDNPVKSITNPTPIRARCLNNATRINSDFKPQNDLNTIFSKFKNNRFDPAIDSELEIPDCAGNYLICLKNRSLFPNKTNLPVMKEFDGLPVLYTGIASKSMRERDFRQHFKGNNAGRSTLRKSIGVLFGYKQIPRDKNPLSNKTKFHPADENAISDWMENNLIMYCLPSTDYILIEKLLIQHFNPPLNLKNNYNEINNDFRKYLSQLRNEKGSS